MPHAIGRFVAIKISVAFEILSSGKAARDLLGRDKIRGRGVNFDAITRAQQQRLSATGLSQNAISLRVSAETFERFDVRRMMAKSDAEKIHGVCVCAVKVIPQRSVNAALKPMMQSAATRFGANHRRCRPCKISP